MPLEIDEPILVKYRKDGKEIADVGYWILERLPWEDFRKYMDLAGTVNPEKIDTSVLDEVAKFLVDRAFVRFEGVLKAGTPLPKERWAEAPGDLLLQMVREIQNRNSGRVHNPNSSAPSDSSSAADGKAQPTDSPDTSSETSEQPSE